MIKRISIIACVVLLMVVTMAVPTFAAEYNTITQQPFDLYVSSNEYGYFKIVCNGDVLSYQWQCSDDNGITWYDSTFSTANTANLTVLGSSGNNSRLFRCVVTFSDNSVIVSDEVCCFIYPVRILAFVSRSIHFVLDWVGSLLSALISPSGAFYSLLPVIAIGIAVTAVLLVVKIFKSFSWGL